ncbi:MAG: FtsW/RodA/SpoVE family cell cycle protein [Fimbriimonas ginsengisoli]|nr:FtsW/RodA/SpoVE family cell cycle protein [Fimbriimonas ginsengisoli]
MAVAGASWEGWRRWSILLWLATLLLLGLVMVPGIGFQMNGAHRWIKLGPLLFQPAEFAKVTALLYLAGALAGRKTWPSRIRPARGLADWLDRVAMPKLLRGLPAVWILLGAALIALEPDLGTAFIILVAGIAIMIAGRVTWKSLVALFLIGVIGVAGLIKQQPYRMDRIVHHAQRWNDENMDDVGFQSVQSELAMASGGLTGVGIGAGRAKQIMPAITSDFANVTPAEEFGLVGELILLGLLAAITFRLLRFARAAQQPFARLILIGVGSWIGVQTCMNVMMANGTLPSVGIPYPFVSSGGSSLIALWAALGLCQACVAPSPRKEEARVPGRDRWRHRRARLSSA